MAFPDSPLVSPMVPAGFVNQATFDTYFMTYFNALAARVADSGWQTVTTSTGYNNNTLSVKLIGTEVHFDGTIIKTTGQFSTTDTVVATLPSAAYAPRSAHRVTLMGAVNTVTNADVELLIDAGSTSIRLQAGQGTPATVWLGQLRWHVA